MHLATGYAEENLCEQFKAWQIVRARPKGNERAKWYPVVGCREPVVAANRCRWVPLAPPGATG